MAIVNQNRSTWLAWLRLEGRTATAGLDRVGVLESEALLLEAMEIVDGGAVEIQSTLLVDYHSHAMMVVLAILGFIKCSSNPKE